MISFSIFVTSAALTYSRTSSALSLMQLNLAIVIEAVAFFSASKLTFLDLLKLDAFKAVNNHIHIIMSSLVLPSNSFQVQRAEHDFQTFFTFVFASSASKTTPRFLALEDRLSSNSIQGTLNSDILVLHINKTSFILSVCQCGCICPRLDPLSQMLTLDRACATKFC